MQMYLVLLRILFAITIALTTLSRIDTVTAQVIPKSLSEGGTDFAIKQRKNAWTVGVVGGLIDGTYMRFADELGKVLDDGDNLRILPVVSYGAASNLDDLLYLRGVDIAVTQSDVFEYFRTERKTPNLQNRVHYILRLPIAELTHLGKDGYSFAGRPARQEGEFRTGGKRIKSDRHYRLPTPRGGSGAGLDRPANCTSETAIRRSCRSGARRWKASRVFQQNSTEFWTSPCPNPVHEDICRLLHFGRIREQRLPVARSGWTDGRYDCSACGSCRLQLAERK